MIFTWQQKIKGKLEFQNEIVEDFDTGSPRGIAVCPYFIYGQNRITVFWIKYFIGMDGLDLCNKTALLDFMDQWKTKTKLVSSQNFVSDCLFVALDAF